MSEYYNLFKELTTPIHPVEETALHDFAASWQAVDFPKKTIITAANEIERYLYIVAKGVQHAYVLQGDKMHTVAFTYPPSFSGVVDSFFDQKPAPVFLESISDSTLLRVSRPKLLTLMEKHRSIETFFRKSTEQLLAGMMHRYYELLTLDIETRFTNFVKRSPHLLQLVPQKYLASYLGIHPTNFSKLLGRIRI